MPHNDLVSRAIVALDRCGVADPERWGLPNGDLGELAGGEPSENARVVEAVARGTEAIDGSRAREVLEKLREETVERSKAEESKHESQPSTSTCE